MDIFVAALILIVLVSLFARPLQRDLNHIRTATPPRPTALDRATDAALDWVDRTVSALFRYFSTRRK